jgi:hypothetical protein
MPVVKQNSKSGQNQASFARGYVMQIDDRGVALVKIGETQQWIRTDTLRGKSAPPLPGEVWILDQAYGVGWQFAVPLNWSADRDWVLAGALSGSWTDVGPPNLPSGYRKEVEGWVTLCGKLTGGVANTTAFQLPGGYRPGGTWTQGGVLVDSAGNVKPQSTSVSLDGVRFMAVG